MTDGSPDRPEPVPPPGAPQPPPGAPAPPPGAPQPPPGAPTPPPGAPQPPPGAPAAPPGAPTPNTPPPERATPTPPPGTPPSVTGGGAIPSHPLPDTPAPPDDSPAPPTESFPSSGAEFGQPIPAPGAPAQPDESATEARPAFGAPPPGAPGAEVPEPPKKKTWLWILLGFFVFAILGIGGCSVLLFRAASAPVNASNDFMVLVTEDRGADAYSQLVPLCQTNNQPAFEQLINDINPESYNLNNVSVNSSGDNTAVVEGTVTIAGVAERARFDLQEVDGDWRVCQFILGQTVYAGR